MKTITKVDLNSLLEEAQGEVDLLPYFVKMRMTEQGIPVKIDASDIRNPDFEVEYGVFEYSIDVDTMTMEIYYECTQFR